MKKTNKIIAPLLSLLGLLIVFVLLLYYTLQKTYPDKNDQIVQQEEINPNTGGNPVIPETRHHKGRIGFDSSRIVHVETVHRNLRTRNDTLRVIYVVNPDTLSIVHVETVHRNKAREENTRRNYCDEKHRVNELNVAVLKEDGKPYKVYDKAAICGCLGKSEPIDDCALLSQTTIYK